LERGVRAKKDTTEHAHTRSCSSKGGGGKDVRVRWRGLGVRGEDSGGGARGWVGKGLGGACLEKGWGVEGGWWIGRGGTRGEWVQSEGWESQGLNEDDRGGEDECSTGARTGWEG